jgi:polyphosphate kinase 2 (PPK2 family)
MLELIDLGKKISGNDYRQVFPGLETRLASLQRMARAMGIPVLILFEGWDAAGKGRLINRLTQELDPRGFQVHTISAPNADEVRRPWLWRFWRAVPAAGNLAIFDRSWYGRVLVERVEGLCSPEEWGRAYREIDEFEQQLVDSGTVIIKFWLHIGKGEQKRRFKRMLEDRALAWKVGREEWRHHRHYGQWSAAVEEMLGRTCSPQAPWTVVEATHARYARAKVFETVITAIQREIDHRVAQPDARPTPTPPPAGPQSLIGRESFLDRVDLGLRLERGEYERQLADLQEDLFRLEHELYVARVPAVIVYEGSDAGGKGGSIRRLTRGLDPRGYEVVPVGPPPAEEKAPHYLWRFWNRLPKTGHITIFDRSWYGRVLVERVEGFSTETEWRRAYREINEFERHLADFGTVIVKFWLHIDPDEQLRRFQARQEDPARQWKITDEDWRNREKWPQYRTAVAEMFERTSTTYAPWTILEANCKLYARIKALRTVAEALRRGLRNAGRSPPGSGRGRRRPPR